MLMFWRPTSWECLKMLVLELLGKNQWPEELAPVPVTES